MAGVCGMSLERRIRQSEKRDIAEMSVAVQKIIGVLARIKSKLPHPLVGIVVATLIAFSGRSELTLRSYGILLIALWLAIDFWAWLLPRPSKYDMKYVFGWTFTSFLFI